MDLRAAALKRRVHCDGGNVDHRAVDLNIHTARDIHTVFRRANISNGGRKRSSRI